MGIFEVKKYTEKYYCTCVCICILNTYMHTYICIYIYIKEVCEKQGIIQNWNQSLLRPRKAFHLDWLFLSCPVLLSPLKQPALMVERDHFPSPCIPLPKGCQQKASSQTSMHKPTMLHSACFSYHSLWRGRTCRHAAYDSQNPKNFWPDHRKNHRWIEWLGLEGTLKIPSPSKGRDVTIKYRVWFVRAWIPSWSCNTHQWLWLVISQP